MSRSLRPPVAVAVLAAVSSLAAVTTAGAAPGDLTLKSPKQRATGVPIPVTGAGADPGQPVAIDRFRSGAWRAVAFARADAQGRFRGRVRTRGRGRRFLLRARLGAVTAPTEASARRRVRVRDVRLAAVGDINLGTGSGGGVGDLIRSRGKRYPWRSVAPVLRRADIAFGNLECVISRRGRPVPKAYTFRGTPGSLRTTRRYAGFDVLNLANNHTGDFGRRAMLDTIGFVRRFGMAGPGAGANLAKAARPRIVRRLGLRVAFVGFTNILPASFYATRGRPGSVYASRGAVRRGVRRARRRADLVVATFHWGVERSHSPDGTQRSLTRTAFRAGADAVIGAHPHVLQPIRLKRRRLVAYSLGNFVFHASSPASTRTGILKLRLSRRGVEGARLRRATIVEGRPRL